MAKGDRLHRLRRPSCRRRHAAFRLFPVGSSARRPGARHRPTFRRHRTRSRNTYSEVSCRESGSRGSLEERVALVGARRVAEILAWRSWIYSLDHDSRRLRARGSFRGTDERSSRRCRPDERLGQTPWMPQTNWRRFCGASRFVLVASGPRPRLFPTATRPSPMPQEQNSPRRSSRRLPVRPGNPWAEI